MSHVGRAPRGPARSGSRPRKPSLPRSGSRARSASGSMGQPMMQTPTTEEHVEMVHIDARQYAEMEADLKATAHAEKEARDIISDLRNQMGSKDDELRKLKLHILQLNDYIDTTTIQGEEEKNNLRIQTEAEARSYRTRNSNMSTLIAQLRQDILSEKSRYDELKMDYDRLLEIKETALHELGLMQIKCKDCEQELDIAERTNRELMMQKKMWGDSEKSWMERVERAEGLVMEMGRDLTAAQKENQSLKEDLERVQVKGEELQLELLQSQRKEGDIRSALAEAAHSTQQLQMLKEENEELRVRDAEHVELINELRVEKQKMMAHLQAGIRERQAIIDSISSGGMAGDIPPQLKMKIVENESLKSELSAFVQKAEEEAVTSQEYIKVLKDKAQAAEERANMLRTDARRLKAELELTKQEVKDVHAERSRAQEVRTELETALRDVALLRTELYAERQRQEEAFIARLEAAGIKTDHAKALSPISPSRGLDH